MTKEKCSFPSDRRENVLSLVLDTKHTILLHDAVGKTMDSSGGRRPIHSSPESQFHHQWWGHHNAGKYKRHHNDRSKDIESLEPTSFEYIHLILVWGCTYRERSGRTEEEG